MADATSRGLDVGIAGGGEDTRQAQGGAYGVIAAAREPEVHPPERTRAAPRPGAVVRCRPVPPGGGSHAERPDDQNREGHRAHPAGEGTRHHPADVRDPLPATRRSRASSTSPTTARRGCSRRRSPARCTPTRQNIDHLEALGPAIERMAQNHVALNILPEHYPYVGEALLGALRDVLGQAGHQRRCMEAWTEAYGFLADVLIEREAAALRGRRARPRAGGPAGGRVRGGPRRPRERRHQVLLPATHRRRPDHALQARVST